MASALETIIVQSYGHGLSGIRASNLGDALEQLRKAAQLLAILLFKPTSLSRAELNRMVRSIDFAQVADWLHANVLKGHPDREALREAWMADDHPWAARAGWSLTSGRVARSPDGIDVAALLDRIEADMGTAAPEVQ